MRQEKSDHQLMGRKNILRLLALLCVLSLLLTCCDKLKELAIGMIFD